MNYIIRGGWASRTSRRWRSLSSPPSARHFSKGSPQPSRPPISPCSRQKAMAAPASKPSWPTPSTGRGGSGRAAPRLCACRPLQAATRGGAPRRRGAVSALSSRGSAGRGAGETPARSCCRPDGDPAAPVWLGVWSGNTKAQALYQRRGFRQVSTYGFRVGTWFDEEYIYKRI